jgi:hypothetical protein
MTGKTKTDAELWARLTDLDSDVLKADVPVEHADAVLRDAGADPGEIGRRGAAFVAGLAKKRRLSWQGRARDRIAAMASRTARTLRLDLGGDDLRAAIARARTAAGPELNAAFRAHNDAEMTDDELRELLADLEDVIKLSGTSENGEDA